MPLVTVFARCRRCGRAWESDETEVSIAAFVADPIAAVDLDLDAALADHNLACTAPILWMYRSWCRKGSQRS